jgi:hypothetical protein
MTLRLNGSTSGYVEIDAPAVAGSTSITLPATSGGEFVVSDSNGNIDLGPLDINGGAADDSVNIDGSGRLLVGTSSSSKYASIITNGGPGLPTGESVIRIQRGSAPAGTSDSLGGFDFCAGDDRGAYLYAQRDGGTWTPGSSHPSRLAFATTADGATTPTERMRIIQQGHVKISSDGAYQGATGDYHEIRQTVSNALLYCSHTFNFGAAGGNFGQVIDFAAHSPDNNSSSFLTCKDSTANRMFIYSDGDVWTSDAGTLTSDVTLKRDITDASPKLADVMNLRVRNFYWQEDYHPNKQDKKLIGFVAQEFEEVFPGLVSEHRIKGGDPIFDEDGNDTGEKTPEVFKKGIKEAKLVPILVKALQEAVERIETLEAKVAQLEGGAA